MGAEELGAGIGIFLFIGIGAFILLLSALKMSGDIRKTEEEDLHRKIGRLTGKYDQQENQEDQDQDRSRDRDE